MASNIYIRSVFWLTAFGGLGYGLMQVTAPSEEKLKQIRATRNSAALSDEQKNKLLFMKRLREAAGETPIYMKKEGKDN